jgi:hypothetical protein
MFPKNYDLTDIENFIPIAEQIHILPILGLSLYEELVEQVTTNSLTEVNSTLLLEVYKVEGIAVLYESLPFCWAHLTQVGLTKGKSDNSDSIENKDIAYLNTHIKSQLDYAKKYLKDWLDSYSNNYPLYTKEETCCSKPMNVDFNVYGLKKDKIDIV